ncbi:hypothetical protein, partial [Fundidesulfovibrio magnetotacticus]|uniref:hypothetical protein n=1 Tax=Fundidesulfovibrio magnetotacticus TaxID=2730080 RepID=UPI001C256128
PGWASPQGAAPGHGLLGWAAATQQPGQPGQTGTFWGDTVPSPWDRHESPEGWQEGGGDGQEEEKPKEAPSPGGTILITTYGTYGGMSVGDHSALYVEGKNFLYDPGGSFRNGERGSGDVFDLGDEGLESYIKYQESIGSTVCKTNIPTTASEEAEIVSRAELQGGGRKGSCARDVSAALGGVCGITGALTPSGLHSQAEGAVREK